jgi:hypothetical protein
MPEQPKKSSIFDKVLSKSKLSDVIYEEYVVQFEILLKPVVLVEEIIMCD